MKSIYLLVSMILLAGCSLLHSPPAEAGTLVVTWVNPTTNEDNSPVTATQGQPESLQVWRIEYGTCGVGGAFGVKAGEFTRTRVAGGPELTTGTNNVPPGNTCSRVSVANTAGGESVASNVVARVVAPATPKAPVNL